MATNASNIENIENVDTAASAQSDLLQLSFIGCRADGGVDLWSEAADVASWADQCRLGRERGREAIDYIRTTGNAAVLPGIARTISERGTFGGVEVGFFTAISTLAVHAA